MNKAFVKEPEDPGDRCPACGGFGKSVQQVTLCAQLNDDDRARLAETAYFCPAANCLVAYFDQFEQSVAIDCVQTPLYPKDPDAPICPCFGLRCEDIDADIEEGVVTRVKAHLQQAKSEQAHCAMATGDGRSCVPAVQKYYMQRKSP